MNNRAVSLVVPIAIITLGVGWLLTSQNIIPGVNWIWILGLGITGVFTLIACGIDKVSLVIGPFLIVSTFFSLLRQTNRITIDTEIPSLFIVFGALMLLAKFLPVRTPTWLIEPPK